MSQDTEITIIIADDHPLIRDGLRQTIEREPGLKILAEADSGRQALELTEIHHPQIVILDVDMPDLDGFQVARQLIDRKPAPEIIFLTVHSEEHYLEEALEIGAKGYVLKDSAVGDIAVCLKAVAAGQNYISPKLTTYLVTRVQRPKNNPTIKALSATEKQVLKLLAEYKTSKEIAGELFISPHTVSSHRANIALKLNLRGSYALIKFALDHRDAL